jgi:hypothetical protein
MDMDIGMLWFDDGPGTVKDKVVRAASFYAGKYGQPATRCLVHPKTLAGWEGKVGLIEVLADQVVLPNHYWIGVEETPEEKPGPSSNGKNGHSRTGQRPGRSRAAAKSKGSA